MLTRYWFRFDTSDERVGSAGVGLGCGVTAFSVEDAKELMTEDVFQGSELPAIQEVLSEVDVGQLDPDHVRPNMGVVVVRGVWFPNLPRLGG